MVSAPNASKQQGHGRAKVFLVRLDIGSGLGVARDVVGLGQNSIQMRCVEGLYLAPAK